MFSNPGLVDNLWLAAGLGLGTGLLLFLLRRFELARRVRAAAIGAVLAWALYLVITGLQPGEPGSLAKFVLAVAILLSTNAGLQVLDRGLWQLFLSRGRRNIPRLLVEIFNVGVMLAVALAILNSIFAVDLSTLLVTSTVVSAVIGLALQDMLGNVISGIALQLDRPFDVGDWIDVDGKEGEVVRMNWRTITIRNIDNQYITIANSNMVAEDVVNYSRPTRAQRMHVRIGLPYGTPPGEVKRVVLPAVRSAEGVNREPAPDVLAYEYGDSAVIYDVRYWITDYGRTPEIRDAVLSRIWYAIRRNGISVPFPIRDVTVRQVSEEHERLAEARLRQAIFEHLRPLPLFAPFDDRLIRRLAENSALARYQAGEALVRQGDQGDSLFVIRAGEARVDVEGQNGRTVTVARRGPDEYFGEMSLLTGERRTAHVIAESEMEVIVVGKQALADVLATDPESLAALSSSVEQRLVEARRHLDAASADAAGPEKVEGASLLVRIGRFLGLD